jgi:hypothetical protein
MTEAFDAAAAAAKAAHSRRTGELMLRLGWVVFAIGVVAFVTTIVLWVVGDLSGDDAYRNLSAVLLGTILTGAATYGTGLNLSMNADRLDLALRAESERTRGD